MPQCQQVWYPISGTKFGRPKHSLCFALMEKMNPGCPRTRSNAYREIAIAEMWTGCAVVVFEELGMSTKLGIEDQSFKLRWKAIRWDHMGVACPWGCLHWTTTNQVLFRSFERIREAYSVRAVGPATAGWAGTPAVCIPRGDFGVKVPLCWQANTHPPWHRELGDKRPAFPRRSQFVIIERLIYKGCQSRLELAELITRLFR